MQLTRLVCYHQSMARKPDYLRKYCWDSDWSLLSVTKHKSYFIERILEYGDLKSIKWLVKTYQLDDIISILKNSQRISAKSANFFGLVYNVNPKEIKCLKKPFINKQDKFSN